MGHMSLSWHLTMVAQAALQGGQKRPTSTHGAGVLLLVAHKVYQNQDTDAKFTADTNPLALQGQNCMALSEDGSVFLR